MDYISNQKQIYYLFSLLTGSKEFDRLIIGLIVDAFLDGDNAYLTLSDLCEKFKERSIKVSERDIEGAIAKINASELFEFYNAGEVNTPFRLQKNAYESYKNTTDLIEQLRNYLRGVLTSKGLGGEELEQYEEAIIDILLETIFSRNLSYLAGIIATRDARSIFDLMSTADHELKNKGYSSEIYHLYNEILLNSNEEFDGILKNLIARFFRFLSLRYDLNAEKALENRFGGCVYYLDSSYIIRLLGFDGPIRQKRAVDLLKILQGINGVQFVIHASSLQETQAKIDERINHSKKILRLSTETSERLFCSVEDKYNSVLKIYLDLKKEGRVAGVADFALYYKDIKKIVMRLIPDVTVDNQYIDNRDNARQDLLKALTTTDKSSKRIKHIVNLIAYIDKLRGGNNYNVSDIKIWLLTTDKETLYYDYNTTDEKDGSKLTVCVMPSELLRMIDRSQGQVIGEHVAVYKQYMLKSHVIAQPFTELEEEAFVEIANIVESIKTVDPEKYDALFMIDNLFSKFTYEQFMQRYEDAKAEDREVETLFEMILETSSHVIDNEYAKIYRKVYNIFYKIYIWLWHILAYVVPFVLLISVLMHIVNWEKFPFETMEDVFNKPAYDNGWGIWLEITMTFGLPIAGWATNRYKERFVKWLTEKTMSWFLKK